MQINKLLLVAAASQALAGCVTLAEGPYQVAVIDTAPSGAMVTDHTGAELGKSPIAVEYLSGAPLSLTFDHPDFDPVLVQSKRGVNGWSSGPMDGWGVPGLTVDPNPVPVEGFSGDRYLLSLDQAAAGGAASSSAGDHESGPVSYNDVRDFVDAHYSRLAQDIQAGKGPTLLDFYARIGAGAEARPDVLAISLVQLRRAHSPADFRARMAETFRGYADNN